MAETQLAPSSVADVISSAHIPIVSIGMPVYNGAEHIRDALDTLLTQTFTDFELIISDNASLDETENICREYAARDNRIRYVRQPQNFRATANFRFVLDQARSEYFMWAAHDDLHDANFIEETLKALEGDDICIMGKVRILRNDEIVHTSLKTNFKKGDLVRFFLEDESYIRTIYMYGLFKTRALRSADWSSLDDSRFHWSDMHFLFSLIPLGSFRSIASTGFTYRLKLPGQTQSVVIKSYPNWLRLTLLCHPWSYYRYYIKHSHGRAKLLIYGALPVKIIYGQLFLWWRGFRKIVLGRNNFY